MKIYKWENCKFKLFGIPIFKIKTKYDWQKYYILGLQVYKKKSFFYEIYHRFKQNKSFDCRNFDSEISIMIDKLFEKENFPKHDINQNRIAFLATEFYDMGGHTECVKSLTELLSDRYEITTFLTNKDASYKTAFKKMKIIEKFSKIDGINKSETLSIKKSLMEIFNKINTFSPKVIFVFMHMEDCFACALLYMLKKYTDIKIIYNNHGSHYPALGMSYADAITFQLPVCQWVTQKHRKINKGINLNLSDEKRENIKDITSDEKNEIRKKLGIGEQDFFTLSGASSYKFFEQNSSPYFEMIKFLLENEPNLKHVVITKLKNRELKIVNEIFDSSEAKNRLKIIDFTPEYSKIFQSCDLFIDSFPVGSALTHVELMKHKKMSVVYVNEENALFTFHEFFPKDYKYKFSNIDEMRNAILGLIKNKDEIKVQGYNLFNHFLTTFEGNYVKEQHINVIENVNNLEKLYIEIDENNKYKVNL